MSTAMIPPAIVLVEGTIKTFAQKMAEARTILASFADTKSTPQVGADLGPFLAKQAEVVSDMKAMSDLVAEPTVDPDISGVTSAVAQVTALWKTLTDLVAHPQIDVNTLGALASLGSMRALAGASSLPMLPAAGETSTMAGNWDFRGTYLPVPYNGAWEFGSGGESGSNLPVPYVGPTVGGGGDESSSGGFVSSILGGLLGFLGNSGGGGGGSIWSMLGGNHGGFGIPGLGWSASMGSLAGLAGFSLEGLLGSGLGIGGSMAGAGIGAGILGLGAGGVGAVGMGTDMAGIGQASGDISMVLTAIGHTVPMTTKNKVNTAILKAQVAYNKALMQGGTASRTFQQATKQMQSALSSYDAVVNAATLANTTFANVLRQFSPVAKQAVLAAAEQANAFHMLFNAATGTAERQGANILNQAMQVGEKFLPTIGKYAAQNMSIMQRDLQPFFTWLSTSSKSGGMGIFTNLEKVFQSELPTGLHALEQGFELLAKTITIASGYLGPFVDKINSFLTRMNGSTFASKWAPTIRMLIGLFQAWYPLLVAIGRTLVDLFKPAVGFGKQFAEFLTTLLGIFDKFLSANGGGKGKGLLGELFTAHATEMITGFGGLLKALMPLLQTFLAAFIQIEAVFREFVMTPILVGLTDLLKLLEKIPGFSQVVGMFFAGWLVYARAFTPLVSGIGLFVKGLTGATVAEEAAKSGMFKLGTSLKSFVGSIGTGLSKIGAFVLGLDGVEGASAGATLAMGAMTTVGILALAAATYELVQHFGLLRGLFLGAAAGAVVLTAAFIAFDAVPIVALIAAIGLAVVALVAGIVYLATHWTQSWHEIESVFSDVVQFITGEHSTLVQVLLDIVSAGLIPLAQHWSTVWDALKTATMAVVHWFEGIPGDFVKIGKDIVDGLINGVKAAAGGAVHAVESVGHDIVSGFKSILGIFSPSRVMTQAGQTTMAGATQGINTGSKGTIAAATKAAQSIVKAFGSLTKMKSETTTLKSVTTLLNDLSTALTALSKFGGKALNLTGLNANFKTLTATIGKLVPTLNKLWNDILTMGPGALKTTSSGLSSLTKIFTGLASMVKHMGSVVSAVAKATFTAFLRAADQIATTLPKLNPVIQTLSTSLMEITTNVAKSVTSGINKIDGAFTALTKMLNTISKVVATIAGMNIPADMHALTAASTTVTQGLTAAFNNLDAVTKLHWGSISSSIKQADADITTPLNDLAKVVNTVQGKLTQAWSKVDLDLRTKWTSILTYIRTLPPLMQAPFDDLPTVFRSLGVQIMEGLASGVSAGTAGVVSAITTAVQSAVTAAKGAAQIQSPSRLFANEVGLPIAQGMALGITSGSFDVVRAAQEIVHQAAAGAQASTGAFAAAGAGAGGVGVAGGVHYSPTYQVTIQSSGDAPNLKRNFNRAMGTRDRDVMRALGAGAVSR